MLGRKSADKAIALLLAHQLECAAVMRVDCHQSLVIVGARAPKVTRSRQNCALNAAASSTFA